jgi:exoribonuclease-2
LFPRPRIHGIITGASFKGTYVRLRKFPVEGMVVRGTRGIDVSDTVRVRLASVDVAKGFIDFERM